jgi:hypothetical protein
MRKAVFSIKVSFALLRQFSVSMSSTVTPAVFWDLISKSSNPL